MRASRLSSVAVTAEAAAVTGLLDGGRLCIYGGVRPANGDTPVGDQPLLAELQFGTPAFKPAREGKAEAEPFAADGPVKQAGEATWFRTWTAAGEPVFDGTVGQEKANLVLPIVHLVLGIVVTIKSFVYESKKS